METTNIYDFLHLLSLIKNRLNMDFWGGFDICTYMPQYIFIFIFILLKKEEKGSQAKTKVRGKKHIMAFIHFFFI
jgi:hypothetical protein